MRRASRGDAPKGSVAPDVSLAEGADALNPAVFRPSFAQSPSVAPASAPASSFAPSASVSPAPESAVGIAELGDILIRRARLILGTTALLTVLGTAAAFLISPRYTASSALFIDPRGRASFQTENMPPVGTYDPNLVDSLTFVMESETVLRRVVATEGLAKDAEFAGTTGDPNVNAVVALKEAVKVKRPERTYVVEIQVRTKDAAKSARLANAIARAYISDGSEAKTDTVNREQGWVEKQLAALEKRLREAEARVDQYKTRNGIHGAEGRLVGEQQLADMNRALSEAQRKAAENRATLDQVETLRRAGRLPDATNEALRSGVIERLRTQQAEILRLEANSRSTLGPRHPASIEVREQLAEVQRQINEELGRIAENARSAYAVARANVQGIERELDRLKKTQSSDSHTLLGLRELERAVEAQKNVYEKFLRDKEAISRLSIETPAGRIIQSAEVPTRATFPNKPLFIALGATAGLLLGVGLALLLETLSRGRTQGRTLPSAPGAPAPAGGFGGARLPDIVRLPAAAPRRLFGAGKGGDGLANLLAAPDGKYASAVDALAARFWPHPAAGPRTLLVSGIQSRQSNPALVMALGLALARRGHAVLLVDGNGGPGSLSETLAARGTSMQVLLSGRRQTALALGEGLPGALYLLPFSGAPAARASGRPPAHIDMTLIDGPALRDAAFAGLDIGRSIENVLAVLPPGERKLSRALRSEIEDRIGAALIGLVAAQG
ncbi:MAG: GumC family protein [Proteobacteria bacterium]|nr:GumC family protein [Pseudomonadota bacterium]